MHELERAMITIFAPSDSSSQMLINTKSKATMLAIQVGARDENITLSDHNSNYQTFVPNFRRSLLLSRLKK